MTVKALCHCFLGLQFCLRWGRNWRLGNGVTVMVVSQGLGKASWTEGGWNGLRAVGESVLVEVVNGIDDGADVLGRLAFREDAIKEISAGGKLKAEVALCALRRSRHKKLPLSYQGENRIALWIDWGLRPREVVKKNHRNHVAVAVLCRSKRQTLQRGVIRMYEK